MSSNGELSRAEAMHIVALREEGLILALVNARIAALGGEMLPLRDGTPAPEPSQPREHRPTPLVPPERGG